MNADHYFPFSISHVPFPINCFSKLPLNHEGEEISGVLTPAPGHCLVKFLAIVRGYSGPAVLIDYSLRGSR